MDDEDFIEEETSTAESPTEAHVSWRVFVWVVGILTTICLLSLGTSINAQSQIAQMKEQLNNADHKLELSLTQIQTDLSWIKIALVAHNEGTQIPPIPKK